MKRRSSHSKSLYQGTDYCLSVPALCVFMISPDRVLRYHQAIVVPGNVLDVAVSPDYGDVLYSIDNTCPPFQKSPSEDNNVEGHQNHVGFLGFCESTGHWQDGVHHERSMGEAVKAINAFAENPEADGAEPVARRHGNDFFYNLESLRKKPGNEDVG